MMCSDLKQVETRLLDIYVARWQLSIEKMPKLRTYVKFKDIYEPEMYIIKSMSRRRRSLMSQFRSGILPLEIEVGRYLPIYDKTTKRNRKREAYERICKLCNLKAIEDEYHFACVCPAYSNRRKMLFDEVSRNNDVFDVLSLSDKFVYIMKHCQLDVSKFINDSWSMRETKKYEL